MFSGFLDKYSEKDDVFFAAVSDEMEGGFTDKALWTKASANANGDEKLINSLYIKYRVSRLKRKSEDESQQKEKEEAQKLRLKQKEEADLYKQKRGAEKILVLKEVTKEVKKVFKVMVCLMFLVGIVLFTFGFTDQDLNSVPSDYSGYGLILFVISGIALAPLIQLIRAKDVHQERENLNALFLGFCIILIVITPVSFLMLESAMVSFPLLMLFVYILRKAISYNIAFEYVLKHNLI